MCKNINEIYEKCLIKKGENYYAPNIYDFQEDGNRYTEGPIKIGSLFLDPCVVDHYAQEIQKIFKQQQVLNVEERKKLKILLNAIDTLNDSMYYKEKYRCKELDLEINSMLKFFDLFCVLRNDTSCFVFNSTQCVEANIEYQDMGYYLAVGFDDTMFEISVVEDPGMGRVKEIVASGMKTGNKIIIMEEETNNSFYAQILKNGERVESYTFSISDVNQFMQVAEGFPLPSEENDEPYDEAIAEEEESNKEDFENNTEIEDDTFDEGDIVRFFKFVLKPEEGTCPLQVGEVSVENGEINGGTRKLTFDEPGFEKILMSIIYHPRNIELLDTIIDTLDDNLVEVKEYLFEKYPSLKNYHNISLPENEEAEEIMEEIYNPVCNFNQNGKFYGFGKTK